MQDKQWRRQTHGGADCLVAGAARRSRFAATRVRRRSRLEAGGSRRRMAQPSGHELLHAALPRFDRGSRPLHRRSRRGRSCPWRRAIRHPRSGSGHFAQRRPELASRLLVFEIDQPGPQAWKRQRLVELGFGIPSFLRLVPVDFEAGDAWWSGWPASGFDSGRPAVVASTGSACT